LFLAKALSAIRNAIISMTELLDNSVG
jgi:hypothetical protein